MKKLILAIAFILISAHFAHAGDKVSLVLDWKPEPEFGGFYAAQANGDFTKNNLDATIKPAGEGAETWPLVATGKADFATTAADQVLIARSNKADVVALFAVYQTSPQGIMVHQARGFKSLADVFSHDGTLLVEDNAWFHFLLKKYQPIKVKSSPYTGGIGQFLAKPDCSQQCFVTSEPILAKQQGSDPQTFLIADSGYNPYTTVVICKAELYRSNPARVKAMQAACVAGWRNYLEKPAPINEKMHSLNDSMDLKTFGEAADAQKPLIQNSDGLGKMTAERWNALSSQLVSLNVIKQPIKAEECFVNP